MLFIVIMSYELELHHAQYIEERMSVLHQPSISLSVPSIGEVLLVNAPKMPESRPIVIEVEEPGRRLTIHRTDRNIYDRSNMPMQIEQADKNQSNYAQYLFATAVSSLTYTRTGHFTWDVNVDRKNINDTHMFREFTGILTSFAWMRQEGRI
jgi:hypothetical protein